MRFALLLMAWAWAAAGSHAATWWKGNLHTHSLWSDGDDYPEMIVEWYRTNGYHFLALSDHNIMLEGERWVEVRTNRIAQLAFKKYQMRFPDRAQTRPANGMTYARLAPLNALKGLFEKPNEFLLIPSEEISAVHSNLPIHINATNPRELITPRSGRSVQEVIQNNINAVLEQRARLGQPMIPHLNHPNFLKAVRAEDLMRVRGERFFEVYNGHPLVLNEGDAKTPSTDQMWDTMLAWRLGILKMEPMYALAVDDSHHYHEFASTNSNSGRGWIMVRSEKLAPESLIEAMEAGEFYATSGVRLKTVARTNGVLRVEVEAEAGVQYMIHFLGTLREFAKPAAPGAEPEVNANLIGLPLQEPVLETTAEYKLKPGELYARAIVISSRPLKNAVLPGEPERAWTQPVIAADALFLHEKR